jgi:hypothetical protein
MAQAWKISETDRPVLERAIGGASLDKLRGFKSTLADLYRAVGGVDATSAQTLASFDKGFRKLDLANAEGIKAAIGDFKNAYKKWDMSSYELTIVKRAMGRAILSKLEGKPQSMTDCYKALGGNEPETLEAFRKLDPIFAKGNPGRLAS